jgi:hypothetical protein
MYPVKSGGKKISQDQTNTLWAVDFETQVGSSTFFSSLSFFF